MFRKALIPLGILFAVATVALPATARAARNPSVTGGGQWAGGPFAPGAGHGTFAFAAIRQQDGTAVGQAEFSAIVGDQTSRVHIDIDCVVFNPGSIGLPNAATLSGIITRAEGEHWPFVGQLQEGQRVLFSFVDHGEGHPGERSDFLSPFHLRPPDPPVDCNVFLSTDLVVEHGNIQVRP